MIPVLSPRLPSAEQLLPYLQEIDRNGVYTNFGPLYTRFRERLADYFAVPSEQVALVANGTLALQAAIETVGAEGDIWVSPSWTFVATGQAVIAARRRVHFADVDLDSWAMPPQDRHFAGGSLIVAPFGDRPDIEGWSSIRGPKVFDAASCFDACRGIGPALDDQSMLMVSLHATKPLPAGEGAVLVGPADWIARASQWANFGFRGSRIANGPGLNAKISEYHAAIGLAALDSWSDTRGAWSTISSQLLQISDDLGLVPQPALRNGWVTSTWNARLPDGTDVDEVASRLENHGVMTRRWWPCGVHDMPAFRNCSTDSLANTQTLVDSVIGLPAGLHLDSGSMEQLRFHLDSELAKH